MRGSKWKELISPSGTAGCEKPTIMSVGQAEAPAETNSPCWTHHGVEGDKAMPASHCQGLHREELGRSGQAGPSDHQAPHHAAGVEAHLRVLASGGL